MSTNDSDSSQTTSEPVRDHVEDLAGLNTAHQAQALAAIMADRCLLRRDMKAKQNETYSLPQEELPECDDVEVQVGDNDHRVVHNHYHNEQPTQPQPQPCPPKRLPWWLIALLVVPWIVLATTLVAWLIANSGGGSAQPVIWKLDIESEPPPEPPTIQPVGE